jgi:3-dehydroquinate synthase
MKTVQVALPSANYDILIGPGLLSGVGEQIAGLVGAEKVIVVSDNNVWDLHGEELLATLDNANLDYEIVVLPAGENTKTLVYLERLYNHFAKIELGREGMVVAFGGGVIGDLTGFAAATWMRGVKYVQIPTSLLAQVDSSVGGKTAINTLSGKNLVGAFYQPQLVLADTTILKTLPLKEFACGMAEVIKYGAIKSKTLFEQLASPKDAPNIEVVIETCCSIKRSIVEQDERDQGERALLNFGHTLGHAIESLGGYSRHTHGEAVAIGMVLAAEIGESLGITNAGCADQLRQRLTAWKLPVDCPYSGKQLLLLLAMDKKRNANSINLVLLRDIGDAVVVNTALNEIRRLLEELV